MGGGRVEAGDPCVTCGRPMRPAGTSAQDHPGTAEHRGKRTCGACTERARKARDRRAGPDFPSDHLPGLESDDPKVRRDARMLQNYMRKRRP